MQEYKELIEKQFPELRVNSIAMMGEGMSSKAVLINDNLVFIFTKRESSSLQQRKQTILLPILQKRITSTKIPQFKYVGVNEDNKCNFVGYEMIKGKELDEVDFTAWSVEQQDAFA